MRPGFSSFLVAVVAAPSMGAVRSGLWRGV